LQKDCSAKYYHCNQITKPMTLFCGKLIADGLPMIETDWNAVFERIKSDNELADQITKLRRVNAIDRAAYRRLKPLLPYFCPAQCRGGVRRSDHFEQADAWVIDADHCGANLEALETLKQSLLSDPRILLMFISPGGDGLKIVFKLSAPCTDTKSFSESYKAFSMAFAKQYQLDDFIDYKTHDCTRVCFYSSDKQAFFNPNAETIPFTDFLPLFDLFDYVEAKQQPLGEQPKRPPGNESHNIDPEVYKEIITKLSGKPPRTLPPNPLHVEDALRFALESLAPILLEHAITITQISEIQYGKRIAVQHQKNTAECNIFFGKRGYSVIGLYRRHHNHELTELIVRLIETSMSGA
jgi:VirE N-terminal domain